MTVYLRVPEAEVNMWQYLLKAIGYWGQTDSFAWRAQVEEQVPLLQEYMAPGGKACNDPVSSGKQERLSRNGTIAEKQGHTISS